MNILFLSHALDPNFGGAPISEASLAQALAKSATVKVICRRQLHRLDFSKKFNLNVTEYNPIQFFLAWIFPKHPFHFLFQGVDVVHLNGYWRWELFFLSRLCLRKEIPYVLHPRGMLLVFHRKILLKKIFNSLIGNSIVRNATRVIALSQFEVRHFSAYKVSKENIVIQPNGIAGLSGEPTPLPNAIAEQFLLYLGRIEKRKNLLFLLEGFSKVSSGYPNLRLLFLGPVEHAYDKVVRRRAKELGIEGRVTFMPPVYGDQKWTYIRNAKAVLYPSTEEAFGRVPFEAIMGGSQPVLPDESGGSEYLQKFIPENIYRTGDLNSLAQVLKQVIEHRAAKLSDAHAWISKDLQWTKVASDVRSIYKRFDL